MSTAGHLLILLPMFLLAAHTFGPSSFQPNALVLHVTEECAMITLSLQSTNGELNQIDSQRHFESQVKKVAWAEHTSLSHSKNKSLSQSKSKSFSQLKGKNLPHLDSKGHDSIEATSNVHSEKCLPQPKVVTFSHPEKSPDRTGNKNAPQPEKCLARPEAGNIPEPEKGPTHPGKKSILQTINKSLSLSELWGGAASHTLMDQVY